MNSLSLPSISAVQLVVVSYRSYTLTMANGLCSNPVAACTHPIEISSFLNSLWLEGPLLISTRCSSCFSTSRKRTVLVSSSQKGPSPREQFNSIYGCNVSDLYAIYWKPSQLRRCLVLINSFVAMTSAGYDGATPPCSMSARLDKSLGRTFVTSYTLTSDMMGDCFGFNDAS
jgi:hypothetical protein